MSKIQKEVSHQEVWPTWPQYGPREFDAVGRVIASQQLFAADEVRAFEKDFSAFIGTEFAVGIGNATQGLHLALAALDVGEGDEVIVTPCSWISSASCVLMQNAIPVFVDIEPTSLGLDPKEVEIAISPRTKAIVLVHVLGYPALVQQIVDLADRHGVAVVEDASHAPGATVQGKKLGSFGRIGVFSLHQRKAVSTGDGGVVTTDDQEIGERIRRLRSFGDDELSYNYRMTEFAGALGRLGLERLDGDNAEREAAAHYLAGAFEGEDWVQVRMPRSNEKGVFYAAALEVDLTDAESGSLVDYLNRDGFPIRKIFSPLNRHPHFNPSRRTARGLPWESPRYTGPQGSVRYADLDLPVAYEYSYGRVLELYTHPGVSEKQLDSFVTTAKFYRDKIGGRGRS